ncbi:MAG: tetratricopeptide repeat protein [Myxococcota bacterium]
MSRLRQEVHVLRGQLDAAREQISTLEMKVGVLSSRRPELTSEASPVSVSKRQKTTSRRTASKTSLPVVRLGVKPAVDSSGDTLGAIDRGEPPVMIRVRGRQSEKLPVDHEVLKRPDPVLDAPRKSRPARPDAVYRKALDALRTDKDPEAALAGFERFLERFPDHHLADNALYWSGEAQSMLLRHEQAIARFRALLADHPRSNKMPWALLRLAESHLALGRTERGHALLEKLRADYPNSEPARLARARLEAQASADR